MSGPIKVVTHDIPVMDNICTSNGVEKSVSRILYVGNSRRLIIRKTREFFRCLIIEKHAIGLGNSLG